MSLSSCQPEFIILNFHMQKIYIFCFQSLFLFNKNPAPFSISSWKYKCLAEFAYSDFVDWLMNLLCSNWYAHIIYDPYRWSLTHPAAIVLDCLSLAVNVCAYNLYLCCWYIFQENRGFWINQKREKKECRLLAVNNWKRLFVITIARYRTVFYGLESNV